MKSYLRKPQQVVSNLTTFLLASIYIAILSEFSRNRINRTLWWLVPLMLLWVNFHAGFALGLGLIGLFTIGLALDRKGSLIRPLLITSVACAAVVLLNPSGLRMFTYPLETLKSPAMAGLIQEWASPDFHKVMYFLAFSPKRGSGRSRRSQHPAVSSGFNPTRTEHRVAQSGVRWISRASETFDVVLMLAVIHHVLVTERIPLPQILELASELTTKFLIVEFVAPGDQMFRVLTRGRDHLHEDLTVEVFETAVVKYFEIVRSRRLGESERWIYLLRKKV